MVKKILYRYGYCLEKRLPRYPVILSSIDAMGVELLENPNFQNSCHEIKGLTLLDLPRLANLWQLCQISNSQGNIIEVGTYRGGAFVKQLPKS